jgi:shikimate kinase
MGIILIGYRGSGKTTVGRRLARRIGRPFVDLDDLIVAAAGKSIRQIFADHGEAHFRDLESRALAEAAGFAEHVIAMGGGALGRPENRAAIAASIAAAKHQVIYLRCDPAELLRRIKSDPATAANRPSLTALGGGIDEVRKLAEERDPIYRLAMTHEIDVTRLSPEQVVEAAAKLLGYETM